MTAHAGRVLAVVQRSAPVTDLLSRLGWTLVLLAVTAGLVWLMRHGWRRRAARQSALPALPPVPDEPGADLVEPTPGSYLATTTARAWLDRIVVHGLGVRSLGTLRVLDAGVVIERVGAPDLFVPREALRGVRTERAIAQYVYAPGGVLVLTWAYGEAEVDTGFRATRPVVHDDLAGAVTALMVGELR